MRPCTHRCEWTKGRELAECKEACGVPRWDMVRVQPWHQYGPAMLAVYASDIIRAGKLGGTQFDKG